MCGIVGLLEEAPRRDLLGRMMATLLHRGPDDEGLWIDEQAGIALGHRRLAIIDPTPEGHQPMSSASGRYVLTYNGEIYNFRELRGEVGNYPFRGHSDTEVMLAAFDRWGVESSVPRFNGMFAFAVWDREDRVLWLARDRLGEKPVYYGRAGHSFVFASELKALRQHPHFDREVDRRSLSLLLRLGYIPAPWSIYEQVRKLPPACLVRVRSRDDVGEPEPYWSALEAAEAGNSDPFPGNDCEAIDALEALLQHAVSLRMVADVPLGAFLSGGIDSSVTVSLMQASSPRPVRTFTIGFDTADYDEAPHAKAVASHLGTDHTELYVSEEAVLDVVPRIPNAYDEPFGDSSQIPTILLSALTRQHVTVALSGDGGDELFAGYDRYGVSADLWRKLRAVPHSGRVLAGRVLNRVASERLRPIVRAALPLVSTRLRGRDPSYRFEHWAELLGAKTREDVYRFAVSVWKEPQALTGAPEHATVLSDARLHPDFDTLVEQAMYIDLVTYLPDDLLVKVDRASMAASLEARVPFLDHRVVEFAWRLPLHMKVRNGATKWALRQVLARHVPPAITERTKMGFGAPIGVWLRGPLRAWAQSLLDADRLKREGYIDPAPVQRLWEEHTSGVRDWKYMLWMVLTFQAWLEAGGA